MKLQGDRKQLENLLRLTIEELRDGSFNTLDERVAEDQAEFERIENKKRREQEATLAVKTLQEELEHEQAQHASEVTKEAAVISKLKDQLHELRSTSSFSTKLLTKEFAAHIQSQVRQFSKKERDLEDKAAAMKAEIEMETKVHAEIMRFLKKTKDDLGEKLEMWEAKSAEDQTNLAAEVERIDEEHAKDVIKKNEYEEKKAEAEAEREAREAEERRLRELEEMQRKEKELHDFHSTKIQAAWRGYQVRNANKPKGKKGKKGKGGKKKKKK